MADSKNKMNPRNTVLLLLIIFALWSLTKKDEVDPNYVVYSDFLAAVEGKQVLEASVNGEKITYKLKDGGEKNTIRPMGETIVSGLAENGVKVDVKSQQPSLIASVLITLLPIALIIGVWVFLMRGMGGGKNGIMGFGSSRARMLTEKDGRITFDDVAGIEEAKDELQELVDFLRNPEKFSKLGGKIPKGALLIGPPGTGKTLLARAVAGEAQVPFYIISGSDFVEMFVGVGARRVRDMFEQAKKNAPCIIFIDEIDAVGRSRGVGIGGGNDEREQTLNQLLVEMDGFAANEGIIIIAATNRKDVLDPALLRPGRFDRQIYVGTPDVKGREKILTVHARNVPLAPNVDLGIIARGTPGFSGADLMNLVNEASLLAARSNKVHVGMIDFEQAKDKIIMGVERKSLVLTPEQREKTAYHEAGHAIVGLSLPKCDPVYKATIMPRGGALGMVVSLPEMDRLNFHKDEAKQKLAMTMAGKAAEVLKYGEEGVSNGPAGDIQQASALARAMVMRWGMSDVIGPVDYAEAHEGYNGKTAGFSISAETKKAIEEEVKALIEEGYQSARQILLDKSVEFERLAKGLLFHETLTGVEIDNVVKGFAPDHKQEVKEHHIVEDGKFRIDPEIPLVLTMGMDRGKARFIQRYLAI